MTTRTRWAIAGGVLVGAVALFFVGVLVYVNVIRDDAPDRFALDEGRAATVAAPATAATTDDTAAASTAPTAPAPTAPTTSPVTPAPSPGVDGAWSVGAGSAVGYRVVEVLFGVDTEGVGRTESVTGQLTLAGTQVTEGSFEADLTTVTSDEDRRDNQFRGRLMDTENFPVATFTLTEPIELGAIPAEGEAAAATAVGELTLRGTTNPVTVEVQAQLAGGTMQVVGSTDIVFADYGIPQPDVPGITTQDHGLLEFDLRLTRV